VNDKFIEMLQSFHKIREEQGEAAFESAVKDFATKAIENGEDFLPGMTNAAMQDFAKKQAEYNEAAAKRKAEQDAQAEKIRQAKKSDVEVDRGFIEMIQASMPAIKSQAQFNAFLASFEALRGVMNAIFARDTQNEKAYTEALLKSLQAAKQTTELTEKLQDVPDAAESKLADEFKKPPRQFGEYDIQRALMTELAQIDSLDNLTRWWAENRGRIDEVVSPSLRNPLIDAVREKKSKLAAQ